MKKNDYDRSMHTPISIYHISHEISKIADSTYRVQMANLVKELWVSKKRWLSTLEKSILGFIEVKDQHGLFFLCSYKICIIININLFSFIKL